MRVLVVLFAIACTPAKTPAPEPPKGSCTDGALLDSHEVACVQSCVRSDKGMDCVASTEPGEVCGKVSCGAGCSCASAESSECICPKLGPP